MEKEKKTERIHEYSITEKIKHRIAQLETEVQQHTQQLNLNKEQTNRLEIMIISKRGAVLELRYLLKEKGGENEGKGKEKS